MSVEEFHGSQEQWNQMIASMPQAHILQTHQWGQVKSRYGWQPMPYLWMGEHGRAVASALVLQRTLTVPGLGSRLRILYVPKGPLLDWADTDLRGRVLRDLAGIAHRRAAIFIKIDPDVAAGSGVPGEEDAQEHPVGERVVADLRAGGWRLSEEQIQFRNTVWIDLAPSLETLLSRMKQKTRYNMRLAERKGVSIRYGGDADLHALYRLYAETSLRDGFVIRDEGYYRTVWTTFLSSGMAQPLIAEVQGQMVAGLVLFHFAGRAWYFYGMSGSAHREKMPGYLLQWEAIRRAKALGCRTYDLWGAPDRFVEDDPMWGVYRFKRGLGGTVVRHIGAWDLPVRPWLYCLYTRILPAILGILRRRGKARTQQATL